jgi:LAO/AO transport system kinase
MRLADDRDDSVPAELERLFPHTGRAHIVGITGNPGAGKSTLVDMLIKVFRDGGKRVAVLAVDPSSPFTGGAILGDRIRMQRHSEDPGVFIRSVATRGHLGGLTRSTNDIVAIMDAMGFDVILIETVGVGQDEVDIVRTAHTSVVVLVPGMGDEIQVMKAGIIEIADVFAINKADRPGVEKVMAELEMLQGILTQAAPRTDLHHGIPMPREAPPGPPAPAAQPPRVPVVKTVATQNQGIRELAGEIESHYRRMEAAGLKTAREHGRLVAMIYSLVGEWSRRQAEAALAELDRDHALSKRLLARQVSPHEVAARLVRTFESP